jgi:hypothetical protein
MCYYYCQHGNNGICDGGKGDGEGEGGATGCVGDEMSPTCQ